jgi:hypothetical protein
MTNPTQINQGGAGKEQPPREPERQGGIGGP